MCSSHLCGDGIRDAHGAELGSGGPTGIALVAISFDTLLNQGIQHFQVLVGQRQVL